MQVSELRQLIKKCNLAHLEEDIISIAKPIILLSAKEEEDYNAKGNSRIGGLPDLPIDFNWPETQDGKLMTFVGQLNMQDMHQADTAGMLPDTGILYFFMGLDEPASNIEHKVIYLKDNSHLVLRQPHGITVAQEDGRAYNPFKIKGTPTFSLLEDELVSSLELPDLDAIFALEQQINNGIGTIGAHRTFEEEAAVFYKIMGERYTQYVAENEEKLLKHFGTRQAADAVIQKMKVLAKFNSEDQVGFMWWDAGCIHFYINEDDLRQLNFDNTYLALTSS
jgi:hypothetical protein